MWDIDGGGERGQSYTVTEGKQRLEIRGSVKGQIVKSEVDILVKRGNT